MGAAPYHAGGAPWSPESRLSRALTRLTAPTIVIHVSRVLLGALLASLAWGGAWFILHTEAKEGPCGDRCGPGTTCEGDLCVVASPAPEAAPAEAPTKGKRRGKRGRAAGGAASPGDGAEAGDVGGADGMAAEAPPLVDDRGIPAYSEGDRTIDLGAGSERLGADVLDAQLRRLTPKFQGCIRDAALRGSVVGSGTITIKVTIAASGKVEGVSASAPAALQAPGIIPCVRKSVHDHRFPSFDGPSMNATLRFDVE